MKALISSTSTGINLSLDEEAVVRTSGRCQLKLEGNIIRIRPDPNGMLLTKNGSMYRTSFRQGWLRSIYPKHGLLTFNKEDFLIIDGGEQGIKLLLPDSLPEHKDLVRKSKGQAVVEYISKKEEVTIPEDFQFGAANLVMAVGKMTLCYKVPEDELLELTFNLAHKGYAIK